MTHAATSLTHGCKEPSQGPFHKYFITEFFFIQIAVAMAIILAGDYHVVQLEC